MEKTGYIVKNRYGYGWTIHFKKPTRTPRGGKGWDGSTLIRVEFGSSYAKHLPEDIRKMEYEDEPKKIKLTIDF